MRFVIISIILVLGGVLSIITALYVSPYYFYNQLVNKNLKSEWYSIEGYSSKILRPQAEIPIKAKQLANEMFWTKFHFGDLNIPIPVKNPFFFVVPNLDYNDQTKDTKFSMSILDAGGEVISDIYFLPNNYFPSYLSSQKIFELPIIRQEIIKHDNSQIWKDAFSTDISEWNLSLAKMAYNLYLLEFRSKLFNKAVKKFGFIKGTNFASVEFVHPDKDYSSELILNKRGNKIHSFILISRKGNETADLIRNKMIKDIGYIESSPVLADIIFKEFKSLKYTDQIDHLGMLYLLSAWSHNQQRKEIFEKVIFYLERGFKNQRQLEPLYTYYYKRYKKIYSIKKIDNLNLDTGIMLLKRIQNEKKAMERLKGKVLNLPEPRKSIEAQYEDVIRKSKIKSSDSSKVIRID